MKLLTKIFLFWAFLATSTFAGTTAVDETAKVSAVKEISSLTGNDQSTSIKSDSVMQRLFSISEERGFSPTSLERYLDCPLKYYYMTVLKLRDKEEVEDDIDASELGNAVHNVLETIYKPFVGQQVSAVALRQAQKDLDGLLDTEMDRLMRGGRSREGKNLFLRSVAFTQLSRVLERRPLSPKSIASNSWQPNRTTPIPSSNRMGIL